MTDVLKIGSPRAAVRSLSRVMGFRPENSLVMLWMDGERLKLTARVDLPDADIQPIYWAEDMVQTGRHANATSVILIVVDDTVDEIDPDRGMPWETHVNALRDLLSDFDYTTKYALLTNDSRLWSYMCSGLDCCPAEGIALEADYDAPTRADVVASVEYTPDDDDPVMSEIADRFLEYMSTIPGRDKRLVELVQQLDEQGREKFKKSLDALCRLVQLMPDSGAVAAPLSVLGILAWQSGNGALANAALARAFRSDPNYRLARLADALISSGVDPITVRPGLVNLVIPNE